ncbi:MAG: ABC transporter ATP-binding protein [Phascolarctobacterium sp.]|nr:ABC transporter ATP-binding protein [Phascolarctobacterium sp.]
MELKGTNLQIGYDDIIIVPDIDITVRKGEITTIIGPNGSGKSTVLKALTRLLKTKKGIITINGDDLAKIDGRTLARSVGVLPQKHSAPPDFKVKDLAMYGRVPYQKWYERGSEEDERIVEWALKNAGAWDLRNKPVHACSGGEAQRVWIATVLAQQPQILFLDEPTTYLDIAHQQETMRLVTKLVREEGIGIVMVLHDLAQALEVSDRIIVIKDGKKYAEGDPEEVISPSMLREVYGVEGELIKLPGRKRPLLAYKEIV